MYLKTVKYLNLVDFLFLIDPFKAKIKAIKISRKRTKNLNLNNVFFIKKIYVFLFVKRILIIKIFIFILFNTRKSKKIKKLITEKLIQAKYSESYTFSFSDK